MPAIRKVAPSAKALASAAAQDKLAQRVIVELTAAGSPQVRDGMGRFGITVPNGKVLGVPMAALQAIAKPYGKSHALAASLWKTEIYEARMICSYVEDPREVTSAQMDEWAEGFDNWAVVDTLCFQLFLHTPHALSKVSEWAVREEEFVKRAAYALLASVALRAKEVDDAAIRKLFPLVEQGARDPRNFVKKAVDWALRAIGTRPGLRAEALVLATRLAGSEDVTARWVGRTAKRDLEKRAAKKQKVS